MRKYKNYVDPDTVNFSEIKEYYLTHSRAETARCFNISESGLLYVCRKNNWFKPRSAVSKLAMKTTLERYPDFNNKLHTPEVRAKATSTRTDTMLNKYGTLNMYDIPEVADKLIEKMPETIKKMRETFNDKYGC